MVIDADKLQPFLISLLWLHTFLDYTSHRSYELNLWRLLVLIMLGSYLKRPQLLYHGKFVLSVSSLPLSVTVWSYHVCIVNLSSLCFEFISRQRCFIACSSTSLLISSADHHLLSSIFVILKFKCAHLKFTVSGRSKCTSIDRYTCV